MNEKATLIISTTILFFSSLYLIIYSEESNNNVIYLKIKKINKSKSLYEITKNITKCNSYFCSITLEVKKNLTIFFTKKNYFKLLLKFNQTINQKKFNIKNRNANNKTIKLHFNTSNAYNINSSFNNITNLNNINSSTKILNILCRGTIKNDIVICNDNTLNLILTQK